MAVLSKTAFLSKWATLFADNTTRDISEQDVRDFRQDISDSFLSMTDDAYTGVFPQVTATGTDTYAATLSPVITAYATGQKFQIKFTNASSGVSTLNLNAIGAKKIFANPTTQATTGHILAGQISLLVYDAALDSAAGGFLMIGVPATTSGTVTSVGGTTNRITSSGGATPVIDIDAAYDAAITSQINAAIVGLWDDRGNFDASVNAYPSSGGSGTAGAILKGDIWRISVAGTLPTGLLVQVGDTVRALVDTPGNTQGNWAIGEGFVPDADATTKGIAKLFPATTLGTATDGAATQNAVKVYVDTKIIYEKIAITDDVSNISASTTVPKKTFFMEVNRTIDSLMVSLTTPQVSGSIFTVDIHINGTTILSTKITIDNTENTNLTALTAYVLSSTALVQGDKVEVFVDQIGNGSAIELIFYPGWH